MKREANFELNKTLTQIILKRSEFIARSGHTSYGISLLGAIYWNDHFFKSDTVTARVILGSIYRPGLPMRSNLIPTGSTREIMPRNSISFQSEGTFLPLDDAEYKRVAGI